MRAYSSDTIECRMSCVSSLHRDLHSHKLLHVYTCEHTIANDGALTKSAGYARRATISSMETLECEPCEPGSLRY